MSIIEIRARTASERKLLEETRTIPEWEKEPIFARIDRACLYLDQKTNKVVPAELIERAALCFEEAATLLHIADKGLNSVVLKDLSNKMRRSAVECQALSMHGGER